MDKVGDVSHDSALEVTVNDENEQNGRGMFPNPMVWGGGGGKG